ncbi:myosin light chain kinase 3 isoform X1 [Osmerus eperlanus]|uniref:myosin light chain kinase 3 isoform X1 n=2 Tax=Osmerus eperlanus TaxID=29151 RepID=UPI002E15C12B
MSKSASLTTCIAKMYEGGKLDGSGAPVIPVKKPPNSNSLLSTLGGMEVKLSQLEGKVERIASSQTEVLQRLDAVCQGLGSLAKDPGQFRKDREPERDRASQGGDHNKGSAGGDPALFSEVRALCGETVAMLKSLQQDGRWQREKMEGIECSVSAVDKMLGYVGEVFRSSKVVEFILKGVVPWRLKGLLGSTEEQKRDKSEESNAKPKACVCDQETQVEEQGLGPEEEVKAPDPVPPGHSESPKNKAELPAKHEKALCPTTGEDGVSRGPRKPKEVTLRSREASRVQTFAPESQEGLAGTQGPEEAAAVEEELDRAPELTERSVVAEGVAMETEVPKAPEAAVSPQPSSPPEEPEPEKAPDTAPLPPRPEDMVPSPSQDSTMTPPDSTMTPPDSTMAAGPENSQDCSETKVCVDVEFKPETGPVPVSPKVQSKPKELVEAQSMAGTEAECVKPSPEVAFSLQGRMSTGNSLEPALESQFVVVDDCPPLPAPFEHRIVSAKQVPMGSYYAVKPNEVLGGGRFGQVHKCAELSSGLTLAAKIIKVKGMRERDEVKNEIGVMNQLNHVNLIQLYDAFESRTNLTLIMEYVEGGELFDRIVDESYQLTELDAIVFTRQICEGVQYLHQQYILHLDLKPENILCVSSTGNQIKIIDFGLARKYRPREKLKVNFGTPEFLAPEVVNYDFVSFPTDMWSVGVITYMLLSGLSPFLGDNDTETMNNILHANWDFDSEAFENVSEEAKDFISRLLIPSKCSRLSASGCMKHSWLNNLEEKAKLHSVRLKSQVKLQRYLTVHRQWKKHFYVVAAANRLKRFHQNRTFNPA